MVSKRDLDFDVRWLKNRMDCREAENRNLRRDVNRLEKLIEDLAEQVGYRVTYKKGLYLEPIEEDGDE